MQYLRHNLKKNSMFIWNSNGPGQLYMYHIFIHSPISWHLCCFHILTLVNNAVMNMVYIIFKVMFSGSSNKYPEVELLGHMVVPILSFWGISILFSIVAAPIVYKCSFFSISSPTFISCLVDNSHSNRCEVIYHCGFDLRFHNN